jgi:hypothetical protein
MVCRLVRALELCANANESSYRELVTFVRLYPEMKWLKISCKILQYFMLIRSAVLKPQNAYNATSY